MPQVPNYEEKELSACFHYLNLMECKERIDSAIRSHMITWEYSNQTQLISLAINLSDLQELTDALDKMSKLKNLPRKFSTFVVNISSYLVYGRKLMYEIQSEYLRNQCRVTAENFLHILSGEQPFLKSDLIDFKNIENIQKKILEFESVLTCHEERVGRERNCCTLGQLGEELFLRFENLSEIFVMICELKKRKIIESFGEVLSSSHCVSGNIGNLHVSKSDIELTHQLFLTTEHDFQSFHSFIELKTSSYHSVVPHSFSSSLSKDNFFQNYLQLAHEFQEIARFITQIRLNVLNTNWEKLESIFCGSPSESIVPNDQSSYSLLKKYLPHYKELQLIESEINHRNLIQEMISSIENLEITLIPNTQNLNPTPSLIIFHRLEKVLESASKFGCHNQHSQNLKSLCEIILGMLKLIKINETHQISLSSMLDIQNKVIDQLGVSSCSKLNIVLAYVRSHQIIHTIYVAVTTTKDSKSLYYTLSKAIEACGGSIEPTLQPWIDITHDLRYMRTLYLNKDWHVILQHSQEMLQTLQQQLIHICYSDEQKKLYEQINYERLSINTKALEEYIKIQLQIMSNVGGIGARGISSYCIPQESISMLKNVINQIDNLLLKDEKVESDEIFLNKKKLIALLNLRESVYDEVNIIGETMPHRLSARKIDRYSFTEDQIPSHSSEGLPMLESTSTTRIFSARRRTMKTLEDTQHQFTGKHESQQSIQNFNISIQKEFQFTSTVSKLTNLVENLEETALLPVVGWKSSANQVQFFLENSEKQKNSLQNLIQAFPDRLSDIPLIKVITNLHELLITAQTNEDYSILDNLLNNFSLQIQVADIPPRILISLKEQVAVFQRGHLLDQLTSLALEGCRLLEVLCFKREMLDEYLTKFTYLANSAGEQSVPQETMSCIRCIQCCRDLCWASELQMGVEFQRFKKQLDKEAEDVPSWFHDKLIRWIKHLPPPLHMPTSRGSISQVGKRPIFRNVVQHHHTTGPPPTRKPPRVSSLEQEQSIDIHFSLKNLSQCLSVMVTKKHTPEFPYYQKPFLDWSNRVLLLNTLWRGLFCLTEDWVTPYVTMSNSISNSKITKKEFKDIQSTVAFSVNPSASPMFHTDIHALSILCRLLNETIPKETHPNFQRIVKDMATSFDNVLATLQPYALNNFQILKKTSSLQKQSQFIFQKLKEFQEDLFLISPSHTSQKSDRHISHEHVANIVNCYEFAKKCIEVLHSIRHTIQVFYLSTIMFRTVFKIPSQSTSSNSYYYLKSCVLSENQVKFSVHDPMSDWNVQVKGSVRMIYTLCCQWSDGSSQKNGLSELIHALQQSTNSSSKLIYRLKNKYTDNQQNERLYCLNLRVRQDRATITIFDPILSEHVIIESTTEFHYILRSNTRALKMICLGAEILQQHWKTHFDPILISSIREILGPQNTGNANADLSTVLTSARENIKNSIRVLEQKCSLLLLTQIGFCLKNYSPWELSWIDNISIDDGVRVSRKSSFTRFHFDLFVLVLKEHFACDPSTRFTRARII